MLKIFDNTKYNDLKFKIDDKHVYVQKCILATNSKYFESKFEESTKTIRESTENNTKDNIIEITEYSYDVYYAFLKYFYTDCIDITAKNVMDLLVLANNHKEVDLKLKCIDITKSDISIENVCDLYCTSIKYNFTKLENFCFEFAIKNIKKICKTETFNKVDEKSLRRFIVKIAENDIFNK